MVNTEQRFGKMSFTEDKPLAEKWSAGSQGFFGSSVANGE
jgi:hypothetical protein